ncbi:hypothetical protein T492DRAFT_1117535 [Pavlovales sp. CCMP2436]|nr:hypothetical protein T492DRAFT_1117535 [Pavlovales sp. CCMP2436]
MQREMAVLMVQRDVRLFEARRHMRAFGRMDRYTEWSVTAWVYSEDGHIEIEMDASMGPLAPPCYIASITGDAIGGDIRIVYYNRGKHVPLYYRRYHRLLDRHDGVPVYRLDNHPVSASFTTAPYGTQIQPSSRAVPYPAPPQRESSIDPRHGAYRLHRRPDL